MSGICAVWRKEDPARLREALTPVSRGLALAAGEQLEQATDLSTGVAVSARFASQQVFENDRVLVACDADLYDIDPKVAALLGRSYERYGTSFVEKLRGSFSFVLWDRRERKLVAAVDGFGVNRLVYFQNDRILV